MGEDNPYLQVAYFKLRSFLGAYIFFADDHRFSTLRESG